ncbi:class I alpha-mannosidase-like protein [Lindgomyces ingoldianus]|uniref:Class I alpha-mannosidase-like protein n=1 Tax=Lindgomyces ingoldianus TaxID=673940 RepID=A0ACB6RFC2_9PLEO|nr:class I alpha-mannosidase-like protein [Lindgomyces ingoldianus]KAF2477458.1 class I alpha-mannosidase-like protein [Lindgomyces ingoldianus]
MGFVIRRFFVLCISACFLILALRQLTQRDELPSPTVTSSSRISRPVKWKDVPLRYPVSSMIALPSGTPAEIPKIQHEFVAETEHNRQEREERLADVKETFLHSWEGYKKHAWLQDELTPVSGGYKNGFGMRAATMVDTLDTLLIMGLDKEFKKALSALKRIDFTTSGETTMNLFETTIRYLGGLLSAYDLSEGKHRILLDKAVQLGDMLYLAFDTPNRLPITRWDWANGALDGEQEAPNQALSAELGSLSLEFTRLSQLTGEPKYFDAVQRISNQFEKHQNDTTIPGLFPIIVNPLDESFDAHRTFTFGGMSDSLYEYFPKQHMLLGGLVDQHRKLYEGAIEAAKKYLFFRPLNPGNQNILLSGTVSKNAADHIKLQPEGQHLACFAGGMVGIGSKIFDRPDELDIARKLVDGCIWAYDSMPTGIMPESFTVVPCSEPDDCTYSTEKWHAEVMNQRSFARTMDVARIIREDGLQPGYTEISDKRFLLRPEAIESVFILYRITGDHTLQDAAWRMFQAIKNSTRTNISNSAIADVTCPPGQESEKLDSCESFWMAETLKYFYLIFSEPELVSLDEWVFNTEAHPLRRPQRT